MWSISLKYQILFILTFPSNMVVLGSVLMSVQVQVQLKSYVQASCFSADSFDLQACFKKWASE